MPLGQPKFTAKLILLFQSNPHPNYEQFLICHYKHVFYIILKKSIFSIDLLVKIVKNKIFLRFLKNECFRYLLQSKFNVESEVKNVYFAKI